MVVISPATTTSPVVSSVSHATRDMRVLGEEGVEDGVRDLVGHLVGVTLGHRFGGEGPAGHHFSWLCCGSDRASDGVDDGGGDLGLGGQGDLHLVAADADDQHGVGVVGEADAGGGDVVGDDQVGSLGGQLVGA